MPCLTIVIPTYPPHFDMVQALIESVDRHIVDPSEIIIRLVVEQENSWFVDEVASRLARLEIETRSTEDVLADFAIDQTPTDFLKSVGKFSFQAFKKIGGILTARTEWTLVLDSESLFLKPFSARQILDDYKRQKYVFYSNVAERGPGWTGSLSEIVTDNAVALVGGDAGRWYMEYYHWFYERRVWQDLIDTIRGDGGLERWIGRVLSTGVFENVLYYQFVAATGAYGYEIIEAVALLKKHLPRRITDRIGSAIATRLTVVGVVEYILSIISVDEVPLLQPLLDALKLPFLRLELNTLDPAFVDAVEALPSIVALTSSHRLKIAEKRVAVCVSGEFRSVYQNIQAIRSFVTGVECDIYVHCWNDDVTPIVKDALRPFALVAERRPDMTALARRIARLEPHAKDGRDVGSLCMFYGIQHAIGMIEANADCYNYVVRLRPDMFFQQSLRELLVDIANDEDGGDDIVYVPNGFHSQGINDQFAIGATAVMVCYGKVLDHAANSLVRSYFNPEHIFAGHLLNEKCRIKTLPMHYVLLRSEPANIDWLGHLQQRQNETWWSAPLPGPWRIRTANGYFRAKHAAMTLMQERGYWEGWDLFVGADCLSAESRAFWGRPIVRIRVHHDYKDPNVWMTVDIGVGGARPHCFVEIGVGGLHLVEERPDGIMLIGAGGDHGTLRLSRFGDDLDTPAAELLIEAYEASRLPSLAYTHQPYVARSGAAPRGAGRDGGDVSSRPRPEVRQDAALLRRVLLGNGAVGPVSFWRRRRASFILRNARVLRRGGDVARARQAYARVLRLDPLRGREWVQYGHVLKDGGDWRAALSAYAMALTLMPDDPDALVHYQAAESHQQ